MEKIKNNNYNIILKFLKVSIASAMIAFFPPSERTHGQNLNSQTEMSHFNSEELSKEIFEILSERGKVYQEGSKDLTEKAYEYIELAYANLSKVVADQEGDNNKFVEKTIDGYTCHFSARAERAVKLLHDTEDDVSSMMLKSCFDTFFSKGHTDVARVEFDVSKKSESEIVDPEVGEEEYIIFEYKAFDKDGKVFASFGVRFYGDPKMDKNSFRIEIN